MDRFCDYHQEKGHNTNDCHQLRKELEAALEFGKLNHLIKDVRQRRRGNQRGDGPQQDVSDEPLIVEAEVEGYLVKRVYVDGGASVEVMFEHCFKNLSPTIRARLRETQTDLKNNNEVHHHLGSLTLQRDTGRTGLKALRAVPSTIYSMMKFPTPRGIATLVTMSMIISECRRLEKKKMVEKGKKEEVKTKAVNVTEEVLINPAFPDQLVVIGGGLPETCKT
ncbi:hypothetical protein Tco_1394072 [Tanacetum coccineum]